MKPENQLPTDYFKWHKTLIGRAILWRGREICKATAYHLISGYRQSVANYQKTYDIDGASLYTAPNVPNELKGKLEFKRKTMTDEG